MGKRDLRSGIEVVTLHTKAQKNSTNTMGNKRYIGAVITDASSGDAVVGVYVVKGYPSQIPVHT